MTDHENSMQSGPGQDGSSSQNGSSRQDGPSGQDDSRERANQDAASRPGVDAGHVVGSDGAVTRESHEGSVFEPNRTDSAEGSGRGDGQDQGLSTGQSGYSDQQGQSGGEGGHEGVSRAGLPTQAGDERRESQQAPGGGSVFQPLQADPRNSEDLSEQQRGNPEGQNQQGLNEGSRERRDDDDPRGIAPGQSQRR